MTRSALVVRLVDRRNRDYYAGALMMVLGLAASYAGVSYGVGSFVRMQAGFFPVALGVLLVLVGVGIAAAGKSSASTAAFRGSIVVSAVSGRPQLRGWICIVMSIVAFVILGKYGGLLPATFAVGFIAALGDRENSLRDVLMLATALCAVAVVVFWWALRLQFPLLNWG